MKLNESASGNWLLRAALFGACAVAVMWVLAALLGAMLGPLRIAGQTTGCRSNLMRVTRAIQMYADDYEDVYPAAKSWMSSVEPYLDNRERLHCPGVSQSGGLDFGYAMNSVLAGKPRTKVDDPGKAAIVFDSENLARSASDALVSLPHPGRHRARAGRGEPFKPCNNIGYADGSVKSRFDHNNAAHTPGR